VAYREQFGGTDVLRRHEQELIGHPKDAGFRIHVLPKALYEAVERIFRPLDLLWRGAVLRRRLESNAGTSFCGAAFQEPNVQGQH